MKTIIVIKIKQNNSTIMQPDEIVTEFEILDWN